MVKQARLHVLPTLRADVSMSSETYADKRLITDCVKTAIMMCRKMRGDLSHSRPSIEWNEPVWTVEVDFTFATVRQTPALAEMDAVDLQRIADEFEERFYKLYGLWSRSSPYRRGHVDEVCTAINALLVLLPYVRAEDTLSDPDIRVRFNMLVDQVGYIKELAQIGEKLERLGKNKDTLMFLADMLKLDS